MNKAPAIIPPERIIESTSQSGVQGYFEVELIHKPTGLIKFKSRFKNLITNAGLEHIGSSGVSVGGAFMQGSFSGYVGVGTGATPPSVSDTALQAQVTRTDSRGSPTIDGTAGAGPDFDYWFQRTTKVFLPGVGTGVLTEVGLFNQSSGGTMFARQLFRDNDGNAITIAKTADDELRITYEFRVYTMKVSNTATATVKSELRTFTTRGYDIDTNARWGNTGWGGGGVNWSLGTWSVTPSAENYLFSSSVMPAITSGQVGTGQTSPSSVAWSGYVGNSRYRDHSLTWNPGLGNLIVGSVTWGGGAAPLAPFITTIEPAITKTSTERFTFVGRFSWDRV